MRGPTLNRSPRPCAILILIPIALAAFAPVEAESEEYPGCPPRLHAWHIHGSAEAGAEWAAEILEVRGDIAILREASIRLGEGKLPPEEARWFDVPSVLEPTDLRTRTMSFLGDDLLHYCRVLTGSEIEALREDSRSRCFVNESGGVRMTLGGEVTVTSADTEQSGRLPGDVVGALFAAEDVDDFELICEPMEKLLSATERQTQQFGPRAVDAVYDMLEQMAQIDGPAETGLAAVPTARHVLATLRKHESERVPDNLPSDFYLAAVAASGSYAEALALERMLTAKDADEEVALKLLGDSATPATTPLLILKLRASIDGNRGRIVSLTLRALLAADRHVARREAVSLLADPRFARPALGVFALTDPAISKELQLLDPADPEALRESGERLLAHLAAAGPDVEVRRAAAAIHRKREALDPTPD